MAIESINPATNKLLRSFEPLTSEAARQKIALAADAFRAHANVPLEHRALWMRKLAAILEHETKDLSSRSSSVPMSAATTLTTPPASSHPSRSRLNPTTATCAGSRSASCLPSCHGTFLFGRSSVSLPLR
jgi:hypothetical protein